MEEELITQEINIGEIIINTINSLCDSLFSSIDKAIFPLLDELLFLDSSILNTPYLNEIMGNSSSKGLLFLANSLLLAFILYYGIRKFISSFQGNDIESPYIFILKSIFICIFLNFSFEICSKIILFSNEISKYICGLGYNIFNNEISFLSLIKFISLDVPEEFNIFSIDGILKSILSISSLTLILQFTFRYILIKILIFISPFAFLSLLNKSTSGFFRSWYKSFFSLLFLQIIIVLILLLPFIFIKENSNLLLSKILLIGSFYTLLKSNLFVKELLNGTGISTDFHSGFYGLKSLFLH